LENAISLTVTGYRLDNLDFKENFDAYRGWDFVKTDDKNSVHYEPHGFELIDQLYEHAHPGYRKEFQDQGKRPYYSVPVLFDEKTQTIVSNESAEIIKMFNSEFNEFAKNPDLELNPQKEKVQQEMERVDSIIYPYINDGVYRMGFARTQEAYEHAYEDHWRTMDEIETLLGTRRYLCGSQLTLSDIRLFVTMIRYDPVYYSHFKGSRNKITEMPNLYRHLRDVYQLSGVANTVNIEHIVKHYYGSQKMVNPTGVYPLGALKKGVLDHLKNPIEISNL